MARIEIALVAASCALGLVACGPPRSFPPPIPSPEYAWSITLTQSGGIAGVGLVVQVSSDGVLTAADQRSGLQATKPLSQSQLERFSQLEAEVVRGPSRRTQSQCRDCFLYDLEILSDRGRVRIQVDDTTIGDSGAFELIELLRSLRDEVLHSAG